MGKKGLIADAVIVGGTAAGIAVSDMVLGANVWDSIKEFYQAHPVGAGFATLGGLDVLAFIASQKVRQAHEHVRDAAILALPYFIVGVAHGVRGLYRNIRHHPTRWGLGATAAISLGALALGGVNAYKNSSLETKINNVQSIQGPRGIQGEQGVPGSQGLVGPQGSQGEPGKSPTEQDIAQAVEDYFAAHPIAPAPAPTPTPATYEFSDAVKNAQSLNLSTRLVKSMFSGIDAKTLVGKLNMNSAEVSLVAKEWSDGNPSNGELLDKNGFSATYDGDVNTARIYAVVGGKNVAVQGTGVSKDALLGLLKDYAMKGQAQHDLVINGVVPVHVK